MVSSEELRGKEGGQRALLGMVEKIKHLGISVEVTRPDYFEIPTGEFTPLDPKKVNYSKGISINEWRKKYIDRTNEKQEKKRNELEVDGNDSKLSAEFPPLYKEPSLLEYLDLIIRDSDILKSHPNLLIPATKYIDPVLKRNKYNAFAAVYLQKRNDEGRLFMVNPGTDPKSNDVTLSISYSYRDDKTYPLEEIAGVII